MIKALDFRSSASDVVITIIPRYTWSFGQSTKELVLTKLTVQLKFCILSTNYCYTFNKNSPVYESVHLACPLGICKVDSISIHSMILPKHTRHSFILYRNSSVPKAKVVFTVVWLSQKYNTLIKQTISILCVWGYFEFINK